MSEERVSVQDPGSFLSTLQEPEANICPAGGQHESASRYVAFELYEYRGGQNLTAPVYFCRKCSALYWERRNGASQPSNRSSSTSSQP